MSLALQKASKLKPEVRLAQAVSQFEADLSHQQKKDLHTYRQQMLNNPPDPNDVMRLTAEMDRLASRKGCRRCFGPRFTNFLQAVQNFAALGDVIVGSSQNIIACGVWSLVRTSLLVVHLNNFIKQSPADVSKVTCKFLFLSGEIIGSPHGCWVFGSTPPKYSGALSSVPALTVVPIRILRCSS